MELPTNSHGQIPRSPVRPAVAVAVAVEAAEAAEAASGPPRDELPREGAMAKSCGKSYNAGPPREDFAYEKPTFWGPPKNMNGT